MLLRNGDRVAGLLEDVEGGVVFVRVSLHDQRKLGIGDVALIDFVGGASGLAGDGAFGRRAARITSRSCAMARACTGQFVDIRGGEASAAAGETARA